MGLYFYWQHLFLFIRFVDEMFILLLAVTCVTCVFFTRIYKDSVHEKMAH